MCMTKFFSQPCITKYYARKYSLSSFTSCVCVCVFMLKFFISMAPGIIQAAKVRCFSLYLKYHMRSHGPQHHRCGHRGAKQAVDIWRAYRATADWVGRLSRRQKLVGPNGVASHCSMVMTTQG